MTWRSHLLCCLLVAALPAAAERPAYQVDGVRQATLILTNHSWKPLRAGFAGAGKLFVGVGPLTLARGASAHLRLPPGPYRLHTPTGPLRIRFRVRRSGKTLLQWADRHEFALAEGVSTFMAAAGLDLVRCARLDRRTTPECAKKLYLMRPDRLEIYQGSCRSVYPAGGSALARLAARRAAPPAPGPATPGPTVVVVTPPPVTVIKETPALLIDPGPLHRRGLSRHPHRSRWRGLRPRQSSLFRAIRASRRLTPRK